MKTNDERRRVAEKLREYASWDDEGCLVDCADWGERVLNLLGCGDDEGECYACLADLIDPDCEDGRYSVARTVRPVDRDALLALADELEEEPGPICGMCMGQTARRIREALGVSDD